MSFPSILRRHTLRTFPPITKTPVAPASRAFHRASPAMFEVPVLKFAQKGVPGLFSPKAFDTAWTQYQEMLVKKLNEHVDGTEFQYQLPQEIAVRTARDSSKADLFNYASQAHNNHFFFEALSTEKTTIDTNFIEFISVNFSNPDTLKSEFLTTAKAMFGNGWVWLVTDRNNNPRILCTYNAGTPYAISRRQSFDMNTTTLQNLENPSFTTGQTRAAARTGTAGWTLPLLNVNVWEHAWIEDFGVTGKGEYLEKWWDAIDWSIVSGRLPRQPREMLRS